MLQYTGINHILFKGLPFAPKFTLGRIVELFPYAVIGYYAYRCKIEELPFKWTLCATVGLFFIGLLLNLPCPGWGFQGLPLLFMFVGVFLIAVVGGRHLTLPNRVGKIVSELARLTAGIFYIHMSVGYILEKFTGRNRCIEAAIVVFVLSGIVVFILKRIPVFRKVVE